MLEKSHNSASHGKARLNSSRKTFDYTLSQDNSNEKEEDFSSVNNMPVLQ